MQSCFFSNFFGLGPFRQLSCPLRRAAFALLFLVAILALFRKIIGVFPRVIRLAIALTSLYDHSHAALKRIESSYGFSLALGTLAQGLEIAGVGILGRGEFGLAEYGRVVLNFLLFCTGRDPRLVIKSKTVEQTFLLLIYLLLLQLDLVEPVLRDKILFENNLIKVFDGGRPLVRRAEVVLLLASEGLFHGVEQVGHPVLFPYLLHNFLLLEVALVTVAQLGVDVVQLVVELYFRLDLLPHAHQHVLYLCLPYDFLDQNAAEISHPFQPAAPLAQTATNLLYIDLRRQQHDQIAREGHRFADNLIQTGAEVIERHAFAAAGLQIGQRRLHEHGVEAALAQFEELAIRELKIGINLINAGIAQQEGKLFLVWLVGSYFGAGVESCQFHRNGAHTSEGVQDAVPACKFTGDVFADALGRQGLPGLFIDFDALVKFIEEKVTILPETVELVIFIEQILAFMGFAEIKLGGGASNKLLQFAEIGFRLSRGHLHQNAIQRRAHGGELVLRQSPNRPFHLVFGLQLVFDGELHGTAVGLVCLPLVAVLAVFLALPQLLAALTHLGMAFEHLGFPHLASQFFVSHFGVESALD